ncbi:MAG: multidrug efflux system protein [Methanoregula sp. PtaU1.Bin006]|nr:MAG: multidrug efflux system protein [Methanoregula sp. PtaB.Bin085]OPY35273.1 MAG: multidrug efflux system protein [Methanoregula sp. PtaU1.Bin006]
MLRNITVIPGVGIHMSRYPQQSGEAMAASAWILLIIAGLMETGWAIGLKYTEGWTRFWPSLLTVVLMAGSFFLLSKALEDLPVGTAYTVWTGIGAAGTVLAGMLILGESRDTARLLCILLIVAGIVGLRFVSPE